MNCLLHPVQYRLILASMLALLKQMYPYLKPNLRLAIIAALCSLPLAAIKAYQVYFIKNVIDGVFESTATLEYALELGGILIVLGLLNYPFRYIHYYGIRMVVDRSTCNIRRDIYKKFQFLSASFYSEAKQGKLLSVMINDTLLFSESFMHSLALVREPLTLLGVLGVALYLDWKLTVIILLLLPAFAGIFYITGKTIRKYVAKAQEDTAGMTHHAAEGLVGQKIIKAFNLQKYMVTRFDYAQDNFLYNKQKSNSAEEHSHPMVETVGSFAYATIIVIAFYRSREGLSVGDFISFVGALTVLMDSARRFSKANTKLNQARAAAGRIFDLMSRPEEPNPGTVKKELFNDKIELKNVTFSYGKGDVIKDLDLTINKGEKVALVGLSGSGKSTIISLLLRLYEVMQGQVLIDGKNINDCELYNYRDLFALVSQDIFLFNDTVLENLQAGVEYPKEKIKEALDVSYAEEFISKLPEGIYTPIGDRGLKLSGGQSQRLTIARAFLRDCPILLFDEATSALDNESEKVVQKAMDHVASHKTVVAVAHRLSTIQNYDRIVVMKEGRKVEEGTHSELLASNGEYQKLWNLSQSE
jgi:subfamily B ATP-binding cassette protein MsbA